MYSAVYPIPVPYFRNLPSMGEITKVKNQLDKSKPEPATSQPASPCSFPIHSWNVGVVLRFFGSGGTFYATVVAFLPLEKKNGKKRDETKTKQRKQRKPIKGAFWSSSFFLFLSWLVIILPRPTKIRNENLECESVLRTGNNEAERAWQTLASEKIQIQILIPLRTTLQGPAPNAKSYFFLQPQPTNPQLAQTTPAC